MNKSRELLRNFVISKSKFFQLCDGEEAVVKFLYAEPVKTYFQGTEVEAFRYHFEINGKEMLWDRTHREFAQQMMSFEEGDLISIKRIGEKNKTKYLVKKVN